MKETGENREKSRQKEGKNKMGRRRRDEKRVTESERWEMRV